MWEEEIFEQINFNNKWITNVFLFIYIHNCIRYLFHDGVPFSSFGKQSQQNVNVIFNEKVSYDFNFFHQQNCVDLNDLI